MNCWCLPKHPVAHICLGKYGDIIQLLPAFLAMYEKTGVRPSVVVSNEFSNIFDGVSYVHSWPMDLSWSEGGPEARRIAEAAGFRVVFPAWWNDDAKLWAKDPRATNGTLELISHNLRWKIDTSRWPDYGSSMWNVLGFTRGDMLRLPLVFDKRDGKREDALVSSIKRGRKPMLLYNFTGKASPFPAVPEIVNRLKQLESRFQLVDLGSIRVEKIYDLLGLFDSSVGLLTSDTATLHLAAASRIPYIAFTQDGWLGSVPRGTCVKEVKYIHSLSQADEVAQIASQWTAEPDMSKTITIRRTAALGDVLAATCVAKQLKALGFRVVFQSFNMIHGMIRRSPFVDAVAEPVGHCDIDLDGCYEKNGDRTHRHFTDLFIETANHQALSRIGTALTARNASPMLHVSEQEKEPVLSEFRKYPRPWVAVGPRSNNWPNRTIHDNIWELVAPQVTGTCFWTGMHGPAPKGFVDLNCRDVDHLIRCLSVSDQFVGVDSGPMHMAAALGVSVLAIEQASSPSLHLPDQRDFEGIRVPGLTCLNCQKDVCPFVTGPITAPPCSGPPPDWIASEINRKLTAFRETVSAIIPIYRPTEERLNKVIAHVVDQVDDIVVTAEEGVWIPPIHNKSGKVRVVVKNQRKLGYGRNTNYGARHSIGKYLLLLNDDVFLAPDAVSHLMDEMKDEAVGVAAHFLTYPDGTIYHAGKVRAPGNRGWGHIDHRKYIPTIQEPCEMENACGASVLARRKAFYDIRGFDEDFFVYAEDDDFMLRMRRAGWKIRYTPHAKGIHIEHQSTQSLGNIIDVVAQANSLFGRKWGAYFDHNVNRVPGNFDYIKK